MPERVYVATGEVKCARAEGMLESIAIGSCVVVCAYDPVRAIGVMAHVMLPGTAPANETDLTTKYAHNALDRLFQLMHEYNCHMCNIEVCLIGAANVLERNDDLTARKNLDSILAFLHKKDIPVVAQSVGGVIRRSARLDIHTGNVFCRIGDDEEQLLWSASKRGMKKWIEELEKARAERKHFEKKLARSEALLKDVQRLTKIGGWEWDVQKESMRWTEETYRIHEIDPDECVSGSREHIEKSLACYRPEDRAVILEAFQCCAEQGTPYSLEVPFTSAKGRTMWIRTMAEAVREDGVIVKVIGNIIDITERKRAELEIKKLSQALEHSPECIIVTDREGTIEYVNPKFSHLTGYAAEEVLGKNPRFLQSGEKTHHEYQDLWNTILAGKEWRGEFYNKKKDGTLYWEHASISPVKNDAGDITHFVAVKDDVTARKQMEAELRRSRDLYEQTVSMISEAIWRYEGDPSGTPVFTYIAPSIDTLLGLPAGSINGDFERFFSYVHEEDRDSVRATLQRVLLSSAKDVTVQYRVHRADGQMLWVESHGSGFRQPDGNMVVYGLTRDITMWKSLDQVHRQAEDHFRVLYERAPLAYQSLNKDGSFLAVNQKWLDTLGYAREEVIGRRFGDFLTSESADLFQDRFPLFLAAKEVHGAEFDMVCKDGRIKRVSFEGAIGEDISGNFKQTHCLFIDMTELEKVSTVNSVTSDGARGYLKVPLVTPKEGGSLRLGDVLERGVVQALMDEFYAVTSMGIAIVDREGEVLVSAGWQDICTQFHRVHPESSQRCIESDTVLSSGVRPGEFKLYKCKNNMWDMATPIMLGDRHIGNIFLGQFLFEDETIDTDSFADQARSFGFDESEYLAALERVPRWSRSAVNAVMSFYSRLATLISSLSWSKLMLADHVKDLERIGAALKESEERFLDVMYASSDAILLIHDNTFIDCNDATVRMLGYASREEVLRCHPSRLSPAAQPDGNSSYEKADEMIRVAFEKGFNQFEWMHCRASGEAFPVEVSLTPISHKGKRMLYCVWRDITEIKKAQNALSDSERRYRELFEKSRDGFVVVDIDGAFINANQAYCEMVGYSIEELKEKKDFYAITPQKWRTFEHDEIWQKKLLGAGYSGIYEKEYIRKDGVVFPVELQAYATYKADGTIRYIWGIVRDLTERKKAEARIKESAERLNLVIFGAELGTWEWNITTGEVIFNDQWARMLGYSANEIDKHISSWERLVHPDDLPEVKKILHEHLEGKNDFYEADFRMKHNTGRWIWISDRGKVIERDTHGVAVKASGIHLDITARKLAEEALEKKIAEIRSRNELMLGREERILEIKCEVNQLLVELGREKKYKTVIDA